MVSRVTIKKASNALKEAEATGFTHGIAHSIGKLMGNGQMQAGLDLMELADVDYQILRKSGAKHRDLAPIADGLGLTLAGTPKKRK